MTRRTWHPAEVRPTTLAFLLLACDSGEPVLIDLDGPRGAVTAPGPWPVRVYADGQPATLAVALDDGPFAPLPTALDAQGGHLGLLPDAPPGTLIRYHAIVDGRAEPPPENARRVEVRPPRPPADPAPPGTCRLAFRWPTDGLRLSPADDGAPQAGVQITVIVDTNLVDGAPARLDVGGRGYSGAAGAGVVAFGGVSLAVGEVELVAEATPAGGRPCSTRIRVRRT